MLWAADHEGRVVPAEVRGHADATRNGKWQRQLLPYIGERKIACPRAKSPAYFWGYAMNVKPALPESGKKNEESYLPSGERQSANQLIDFRYSMIRDLSTKPFIIDYHNEWQFDHHLNLRVPSHFPAGIHGEQDKANVGLIDGGVATMNNEESLRAAGHVL